jgi:exo-beta-1,3-glucanase (GH17 family)
MLGIWLDGHKSDAHNQTQVDRGIELANRFEDIVLAVNVGNEIFVYWSWHKIDDIDKVIEKIRYVRSQVNQPVTVSDDYNFWNKPESKRVAAELDFICMHAYAVWNRQLLADAMDWTETTYQAIQAHHPGHTIAFCETGWPTSKVSSGDSDEARLVKARVGEAEQSVFFDQYDQWVNENHVISFYFTSFDEKWKGGFDGETPMKKMEKHWGLYFSDRNPKRAMQ